MNQSEDERLREQIEDIIFGDTPRQYFSDNMLAKPDAIMALISQKIKEARIDERKEFRKLWDDLHMRFGASAGSATGVTVENDFGEEFDFQLDRYALNALFAHMNATLTQGIKKEEL